MVFVSALPHDARMITQLIKELEMAGKGWIWFGSIGTTTQHFRQTSNIGRLLNGMIGVNPKDGEGPTYTRFRTAWKSKDSVNYPGIIHSSKVRVREICDRYLIGKNFRRKKFSAVLSAEND